LERSDKKRKSGRETGLRVERPCHRRSGITAEARLAGGLERSDKKRKSGRETGLRVERPCHRRSGITAEARLTGGLERSDKNKDPAGSGSGTQSGE